jgi:hypothetical protein
MKKIHLIFLMMSLVAFLATCSTASRITSSWSPRPTTPILFKKVIVLGLIHDRDRTLREHMEQSLAAHLRSRGQEAVCACDLYAPREFDQLTEKEALAKLSTSGVDGVLTVVLLDKERERYYVPGQMQFTPYGFYYDRFWGYSRTLYWRIYSPGYYTTNTRYFWETNLYDLSDSKLIYSAQSQSFDPSSSDNLGKEYGKLIVDDIVNKGIIVVSSTPSKGL